ncbi:anti-sigma regulatory factor [Oceanobacillus sp. CAU 1775]
MEPQSCLKIKKEWDIVAARQLGREMAKELGFSTVDQARIATAISELARNIYLYAEEGSISYKVIYSPENKAGLCLTVEDRGPGIPDIGQVMQDGFTTSGGLGAGLPGVKRLMDDFDLETKIDVGTTITTTKWLR